MGFLPNNIKAPSEGGGGSGNYLEVHARRK